jgi:glycosyltransferase involved in cell wall biosynthesis
VVLGGNSRFFYELLPLLKPEARCFDLLHAVASVEHFSLPYVPRLAKRVFITAAARDEFAKLYAHAAHGEELKQRMTLIENCVDVPAHAPPKPECPLQVLFVGRGSPEKRIHLVGRIAAECKRRAIAAEFTLVGDCESDVAPEDRAACRFAGMVRGPQAIAPYYQRAHVLLLTSSREGFPLVVMEAMAQGAVPVCTNVGGMPAHVSDAQTGVLLPAQEDAVVSAAVEAIAALAADRPRLAALSAGAFARAREYFSAQRFVAAWRGLLLT